jgi:hypothetical protein
MGAIEGKLGVDSVGASVEGGEKTLARKAVTR